jgi:hypothetical protein
METQQRQQLEAQQQDISAWFSFASIYGSVDEAGSTRDSTRDERKPRARAPLPLPESSRAALAAHVASLLATCNLRALSVLITALGNDVVLAAVPLYSFPLPALVPSRPPLTQDCKASLYETRTVGVVAPRFQEGHGQLSAALTLAASATPRASATPPVVAHVRASEREGCSPTKPPGPTPLASNEYRLQLMFVRLLLLIRDRESVREKGAREGERSLCARVRARESCACRHAAAAALADSCLASSSDHCAYFLLHIHAHFVLPLPGVPLSLSLSLSPSLSHTLTHTQMYTNTFTHPFSLARELSFVHLNLIIRIARAGGGRRSSRGQGRQRNHTFAYTHTYILACIHIGGGVFLEGPQGAKGDKGGGGDHERGGGDEGTILKKSLDSGFLYQIHQALTFKIFFVWRRRHPTAESALNRSVSTVVCCFLVF